MRNKFNAFAKFFIAFIAIIALVLVGINIYIVCKTRSRIYTFDRIKNECELFDNHRDYDCIIVLGASVKPDGNPSDMLEDRIITGDLVYNLGITDRIIMSGDHGEQYYNEVQAMKNYAISEGIPSEDIFMDHAGFSTYESIYRAKEIFGANKIIIVTQEYHLYRALYIADRLGVDAIGVSANRQTYYGQWKRDIREFAANIKAFGMCIYKPEPTYLGDRIDLTGSGDVTND